MATAAAILKVIFFRAGRSNAANIGPVLLSGLAVALRIASIGMVASFAQNPEVAAQFLPGKAFVSAALIFFLLFAAAAGAQYLAERTIIARAIFTERKAHKALQITLKTRGTLAKAPHYLGRMTLAVYRAATPAISAAISIVIMFALEPALTGIILASLLIFSPIYLAVARRGAKSVKDMLATAGAHLSDEDGGPSSDQYLDAYARRLLALFEARLVSGIAKGLAIGAIGAWLAYDYANGAFAPGPALFYVLLAHQFGSGVQAVAQLSTQLAVFHTFVRPAMPILEGRA